MIFRNAGIVPQHDVIT